MVHMHISTNHVGHFVRILSFKKFRLHKVVEEEELKRREAHWAENPKGRLRQKLESKKERKRRKARWAENPKGRLRQKLEPKNGEKLAEPKTQKGGSGKS